MSTTDWPLPPLHARPDGSTYRTFTPTPVSTPTCTSAKGARNGTCARTACNNSHAIHFNRITERWYCTPCARRINEVPQHDGEPLCSWPTREQIGPDHLLLPEVTP